jgi:hypothetical protein
MPRAAGRKAAAVGSLLTGAVLAALSPAPPAHAAPLPATAQPDITADPSMETGSTLLDNTPVGEATHGLGDLSL